MSYSVIALILCVLTFTFYLAAIYSDRLRAWTLRNSWVMFGLTDILKDLDRGFRPGDSDMFLALFLQILMCALFSVVIGLIWPIGIPMLLFFRLSIKKFTR
jgi:hypothetical protein